MYQFVGTSAAQSRVHSFQRFKWQALLVGLVACMFVCCLGTADYAWADTKANSAATGSNAQPKAASSADASTGSVPVISIGDSQDSKEETKPAVDPAGWVQDEQTGAWRYRNSDGMFAKEWLSVNGKRYWLGSNGVRTSGWQKVGSYWYYFSPNDGSMSYGWVSPNGYRYYLNPSNGRMLVGWQKIDGYWYYLRMGDSGRMLTGWQKVNGYWYYLNPKDNGRMLTGWQKINGYWFYLRPGDSGRMLTDWQKINGYWYYLRPGDSGRMLTGWQKINGYWFYLRPGDSGRMLTGWQHLDGHWYYLRPGDSGRMLTGWQNIGGRNYFFNASGIMQNDRDNPGRKIVYLTFDDGPSQHTARLLNILDRYDTKATFFVVHSNGLYVDKISDEAKAGHTVAVHSYTHDFYNIYSSSNAFWSDFNRMQNEIFQKTGQRTNLFRFAGGSSNTISRFNPGIMTRLVSEARAKGYFYFDWNVGGIDAGSTTSSSVVMNNAISGMQRINPSVVLLHDSKGYTVDAVEGILRWGIENGYTFMPLTSSSPGAHHNVQN